jgi:hypothetical protein
MACSSYCYFQEIKRHIDTEIDKVWGKSIYDSIINETYEELY